MSLGKRPNGHAVLGSRYHDGGVGGHEVVSLGEEEGDLIQTQGPDSKRGMPARSLSEQLLNVAKHGVSICWTGPVGCLRGLARLVEIGGLYVDEVLSLV